MPINHELKTLFVHVPKCGGTTVEKILDMSTEENFFTTTKTIHKIYSKLDFSMFTSEEKKEVEAKNLQHCTIIELEKLLPKNVFIENNYYKFSIVRNPYHRIVSEYFYMVQASTRVNQLRDFPIRFPNVSSFVLSELALPRIQRIRKYDGHLETQSSFLLDANSTLTKLNKIYRFESEMESCLELAKSISKMTIEGVHERNGGYDKTDYSEYFTFEAKELVYQFYKNDFDLFKYSKL